MADQKAKANGLEIAAISAVPLILVLGNSMLIPILPKMKSVLNLTQFQVSLVITAFSISAGLAIPILGYLSDRFSRKAIMIPCLILYGGGGLLAGSAAAWFGNAYLWIMSGRIIQGIGAAGTAPIAMALTGDLFKGGQQSRVLGLAEASNALGKVVSPILGALFSILFWYAAFFAFPVFCAVSIILLIFFVKEKKTNNSSQSIGKYMKGLFGAFRTEGRWLFAAYLTGAVGLFTLFGILFYLSDILEKYHNINGVPKGGVLAIPLLFLCTTAYFTGAKIKKNQALMKKLIVFGLFLMTASFATLIFFDRLIPFIGVLVFSSIGTGLILPCLNSLITGAVNKEKRGFVTSLYGSVRFLGVAAGPPVYGWLMGISQTIMFLSTAALTFVVAFIVIFLIHVKKEKQPTGEQEQEQEHNSLFRKLQLNTE
ncbi:MAG TPA: MFS transporter [Bacillales bacterium]|nr:MFS transporter [Bacillales bacterium]